MLRDETAMTFAKLLRLASPAPEGESAASREDGWPYDNPMLLGIARAEFTASVRRALWVLLGEARNLRSELERTRALLKRAEEAVDRDHLLPILNRRAFVRELDRQIASVSRYGTPASLAYIDLDALKIVNDAWGHPCGDALLVHFTSLLLLVLRRSDIVGRLGGDEFGVVLLHTEEHQAPGTFARIAAAIDAKPLIWQNMPIPMRFTAGVAQLADGMDAEATLAAADAAMYRQKTIRR
jgi:diguanylate cyclase (GGDEF)-like protein